MPTPLPDTAFDLAADLAACRATLRGGSRSFFAASLLLPATVVRRASAIYAFCRDADDLIDNGGGQTAIDALSRRLDAIFAGRPQAIAADRALAAVVAETRMSREPFDALVEGFAWDVAGRRYETIGDLHDYAARVAGSVGVLMSVAMDRTAASVLSRAADLGVAMQLTNIARDVGEDAQNGRLYLPQTWMREAGVDPDSFLVRPEFSLALAGVVQRLLDEADHFYRRADAGLARLPTTCRFGIRAASRLYEAIGTEVMRNGCDSVSSRAVVPAARKIAAVTARRPLASDALHLPPLAATRFLVDAAVRPAIAPLPAWWDLRGRTLQALAIFERLERADRGIRVRA